MTIQLFMLLASLWAATFPYPAWAQSGFTDVGRDGCRVPLPWSGSAAPYGFSSDSVRSWLPQPDDWGPRTVAAQQDDPDSFLRLYRAALAARPTLWVGAGEVQWLDAPSGVLAFSRGDAQCWANTGSTEIALPEGLSIVLASEAVVGTVLPPDTAVWLS